MDAEKHPRALTRRHFLSVAAGTLVSRRLAVLAGDPAAASIWSSRFVVPDRTSTRPVPTLPQLSWQRDELALFLHFGVNTFTNREWGTGKENPAIFMPKKLDAGQWARAAKAAGFRAMILTAKHHDGFCLWPTATTKHSVASSPWRGGKGDVVRDFVQACRAEGLKAGLYCSPWDRNAPSYGSPRYNDVYCAQLTELLTHYGPISEVWFDGANGEGPNGKHQVYDWPRFWRLVRKLQPDAVIFSDAGPDIRWIGNERGVAGDPDWSPVDPSVVPYPGASGPAVTAELQHGDPEGTVWRPGETDVSIRPGWFWHPDQNDQVRSVDDLVDLYFTSVGRNSKLLLNTPPDRDGLIYPTDVARIAGMHAALGRLFAEDLAAGHAPEWRGPGARTAEASIDLGGRTTVGLLDLAEDITRGQSVERWSLEGSADGHTWSLLASGTTVGYRRLKRFRPTAVHRVRVRVTDRFGTPPEVRIGLYEGRAS